MSVAFHAASMRRGDVSFSMWSRVLYLERMARKRFYHLL
jgi:hypothetical protein